MSIVVCKVTPQKIIMGSDSRITYSDCNAMPDSDLKLFADEDVGIIGGTAGYAEHAVALRAFIQSLTVKAREEATASTQHVTDLIADFTKFADDRGIKFVEDQNVVGHFMLASKHGAWIIEGGYIKSITDYDVIGCGETSARPIMYTGGTMHAALDAACQFNIHCAYPLVFFEITRETNTLRKKIITYPTGKFLADTRGWTDI